MKTSNQMTNDEARMTKEIRSTNDQSCRRGDACDSSFGLRHSFVIRASSLVIALVLLSTLNSQLSTAHAQGTAFTYQGRLNDDANPASGIYDLRFAIYATSGGGGALTIPLTNSATAVSNGLFTVTLDFGTGIFTGADRWLEIGVRSNGLGAFTALSPRQAVTPTPYAIYAKGASAAGITGNLPSSTLQGIYSAPLTFNNGANSFSGSFYGQFFGASFTGGSFSGDGSGLLNLNASQISEGSFPASSLGNAWRIIGNSGTTETNFIGTTDNQALEFRVANLRAFRIEPDPRPGNNAANIIGGYISNRIELPGSGGSVIVGGGFAGGHNIIRSNSSGVFIGGGSANIIGPNANDVVIAGGFGNRVQSGASAIGGGYQNIISSNIGYAVISGGVLNTIRTNSYYSTIGGGYQNTLESESATIGGGVGNVNKGYAATIAGGFFNKATNNGAFVGGGGLNVAYGFNSVVAGGAENFANEQNAVIGGGSHNTNRAAAATIAGGILNQIGGDAFNSTIGGGSFNEILTNSPHGTIPGGEFNAATNHAFAAGRRAKANHTGAFVWSDSTGTDFNSAVNNEFAVRASGGVRFVTSGAGFTLNGQPVLTAGSTNALTLNNPANIISGTFTGNGSGLTNLNAATLGGLNSSNFWQLNGNTVAPGQFLGSVNNEAVEIKVNDQRALRLEPNGVSPNLVGGYAGNSVGSGSSGAVIAGGGASGSANTIGVNSSRSTIGGGEGNLIDNSVDRAVIAGGANNKIIINGAWAVIGGGRNNVVGPTGDQSVIAGGAENSAQAAWSVIGGGLQNTNASTADKSTIGGGSMNFIGGGANEAVIGGGRQNTVVNDADYATVPGGFSNTVTAKYAFAAGRQAKANHQGAFVWADSQNADFASTANDQFLIRASGNVGINTNNPQSTLHVNGQVAANSIRSPGAGINTGTFAFTHRAVGTNTGGNVTTIYNPLTDGDANAILVITHNWSRDTNSVTSYNTNAVGVYYDGFRWAIFNENSAIPMGLGRAFNVLVVKP